MCLLECLIIIFNIYSTIFNINFLLYYLYYYVIYLLLHLFNNFYSIIFFIFVILFNIYLIFFLIFSKYLNISKRIKKEKEKIYGAVFLLSAFKPSSVQFTNIQGTSTLLSTPKHERSSIAMLAVCRSLYAPYARPKTLLASVK